ncbi:MAG: hypothetical protein ACK2U2_23915, partial [Anaerolineae bacterium]
QFRRMPKLLVVGARANVRHLADDIVEDLFGDGAEEFVAGDLPGVEVDVCLSAPSSCALSYNMRSKCPAQPDTRGLMVTARLVLDSASRRDFSRPVLLYGQGVVE